MSSNYAQLLGISFREGADKLCQRLNQCVSDDDVVSTLEASPSALIFVLSSLPSRVEAKQEYLFDRIITLVSAHNGYFAPQVLQRLAQVRDGLELRRAISAAYDVGNAAYLTKGQVELQLAEKLAEVIRSQMAQRPVQDILDEAEAYVQEFNKKERVRAVINPNLIFKTVGSSAAEEALEQNDFEGLHQLVCILEEALDQPAFDALTKAIQPKLQEIALQAKADLVSGNLEAFPESFERLLTFVRTVPPANYPYMLESLQDVSRGIGQQFVEEVRQQLKAAQGIGEAVENQEDRNRMLTGLLQAVATFPPEWGLGDVLETTRKQVTDELMTIHPDVIGLLADTESYSNLYLQLVYTLGYMREFLDTAPDLEQFLTAFQQGFAMLMDYREDLETPEKTDLMLDGLKSLVRAFVERAANHVREVVGQLELNLNNPEDLQLRDRIQRAVQQLPALLGTEIEMEILMQTDNDRIITVLVAAGMNEEAIQLWLLQAPDDRELFQEWVGLNLDNARIQFGQFADPNALYAHFQQDMYGDQLPANQEILENIDMGMGPAPMGQQEQVLFVTLQNLFPELNQEVFQIWVENKLDLELFGIWITQNQIGQGSFPSLDELYQTYQAMMLFD